jgi:hypothetical protein
MHVSAISNFTGRRLALHLQESWLAFVSLNDLEAEAAAPAKSRLDRCTTFVMGFLWNFETALIRLPAATTET